MKFAKAVSIVLNVGMLIGLAGCWSAPSERDVRATLGKMTGNCKYFKITHVLKVNWPLPDTSDYQVDFQYSIQTAPLPGAQTVATQWAAPLAALNARLAAVHGERDKNYNINADFLDRIERAQHKGDDAASGAYERQRLAFVTLKLDPVVKLARDLEAQKIAMIQQATAPLREAFFKVCPNTTQKTYDEIYDNQDLAQFVKGHTVDSATTIRMTRTGKGWEFKEPPKESSLE